MEGGDTDMWCKCIVAPCVCAASCRRGPAWRVRPCRVAVSPSLLIPHSLTPSLTHSHSPSIHPSLSFSLSLPPSLSLLLSHSLLSFSLSLFLTSFFLALFLSLAHQASASPAKREPSRGGL